MFNGVFSKNFWIATIVAIAIIYSWDYFFLKNIRLQQQQLQETTIATNASGANYQTNTTSVNQYNNPVSITQDISSSRTEVIIKSDTISGAINLKGGIIDKVELAKYQVDISPNSKNIVLFDNINTTNAYYFLSGWVGGDNLPNIDTLWKVSKDTLLGNDSVVLTWNNGQGLLFTKTISLDNNYLFTITDEVVASRPQNVSLSAYSLILRQGTPKVEDLFISHEGFVGYFNNTLERVDYDDVKDQTSNIFEINNGFIGFTDKYWLTSIIANNNSPASARFINFKNNKVNNYQVDLQGKFASLENNKSISSTVSLFVGPKSYNLLNNYNKKLNITHFEDAIDFGWFFFFTKPMITFLLFLYNIVGNFGLAILVFTIVIRVLIFPVGYKSYISLAKMKELQPRMKLLKEQNVGNMPQYNKEVMLLYKKEKVNPLSGCIPILLQIPIFFSIYKVIFISIELRHSPFYGWVRDMSAKDPTNLFNLFGLLPFSPPTFLALGLWPIIMGLTMFIQQKFASTTPTDPIQKKVMDFMPVVLTFVLASFPVGLVIYWSWSNVISIIQQFIITRLVSKKIKKN